MAFRAWTLVALVGGMAGILSFLLLRTRLQARYNPRPTRDGWTRGRLALAGYSTALLILGVGLGGAAASWISSPWDLPRFRPLAPLAARADTTAATWDRSLDAAWYSLVPPTPRWDSAFTATPVPVHDTVLAARIEEADEEPRLADGVAPDGPDDPGRAEAGSTDVALPRPVAGAGVAAEEPAEDRDAPPAAVDPDPAVAVVLPREEAPPPPPTPWAVRVGVFRQTGNVDGVVADLRRNGYTPLVVRRPDSSDRPVYYIYAGAYATRARALEVVRELRARGTDAMVVEIDTGETAGAP